MGMDDHGYYTSPQEATNPVKQNIPTITALVQLAKVVFHVLHRLNDVIPRDVCNNHINVSDGCCFRWPTKSFQLT